MMCALTRKSNVLLASGIELLRELDSVLDFAKSTIQLELILYMGSKSKGIRAREAALALGIRTKSVYDALTKLISKGLVLRRADGTYVLTEEGERFVRKVLKLLSGGHRKGSAVPSDSTLNVNYMTRTHFEVSKNLLTYKYIYDTLLILGLTERKEMPLNELAKKLGVTPATLSSYLDVATSKHGRLGFLKKVMKSRGNGRMDIYYRLTEAGLQEVSRFTEYRKIKNSMVLKTLLKITGSYNVWGAFAKLSIMLSFSTALLSLGYAITSFDPFLWVAECLVACMLGLTVVLSRVAYSLVK